MMTTDELGLLLSDNGTSRADTLCQRDAQRAGLWGHYSALVPTKQRRLQNITTDKYRHLPVVNTMVSICLHPLNRVEYYGRHNVGTCARVVDRNSSMHICECVIVAAGSHSSLQMGRSGEMETQRCSSAHTRGR